MLHNIRPFKESYFRAICLFLKSSSGKSFIDNTIYAKNLSHQVEVLDDSESLPSILIKYFDYGEEYGSQGAELMANFEIKFTRDYSFGKIVYSEHPQYTIDEITLRKKEIQDKWGMSLYVVDDEEPIFVSRKIKSVRFRLLIGIRTIRNYFSLLLSNKDTFDLSIPVMLNLSLFIYCVFSARFSIISEFFESLLR